MTVSDPTLRLERRAFAAGARAVIGCDEVGRGAIAGPVFVAAVAIGPVRQDAFPAGLRDSKMLSEPRRRRLEPQLRSWATAWAIGSRRPDQIDRFGIVACLAAAGADAVRAVRGALDLACGTVPIILDGSQDWLTPVLADQGVAVTVRPRADRDCAVVAAASVLAKVARDRLMIAGDRTWPVYGWAGNKGYGSAAHRAAIAAAGPSPWHRLGWIHPGPPAAANRGRIGE